MHTVQLSQLRFSAFQLPEIKWLNGPPLFPLAVLLIVLLMGAIVVAAVRV